MKLKQLEQKLFSLKMSINSNYGLERSYGYETEIYNEMISLKKQIKEEQLKIKREKKLTRILNEPLGTN